jgi:hypothetical protein
MRNIFIIFLAVLAIPFSSLGQTSRGTVTGMVNDTAGASIPSVTVILTNIETNVSRTTTTNEEGLYRFDAVELGIYSIKFSASNFGTLTKTNLTVSANQVLQLDAQLSPKGVEHIVDISSEAAAQLQTETPVRGGNINERQITELPIASRNAVSLALTLPGVSSNRYSTGVGTFSVNGARNRSNNFLIDGTENNDISVTGQGFQIKNVDAIQEVSVQTSNYDSEFGRAGGAVVNVITKGGTNEYHGTLSYMLDSTADDAITNTQGLNPAIRQRGRPPFGIEQRFSGTFGGPVKFPLFGEGGPALYEGKDKTFFFVSYLNLRRRSNTSANVFTLSSAGRARLRQLFPIGTNRNVDTYLAVTEGVNATANLSNIDLGNNRGPIQFGDAAVLFPQSYIEPQFQARVDHNIGDNDQLMVRYLFADVNDPFGGATLRFPGFTTGLANRYQNFLISETHTFSPRVTNELRLAYNRIALAFPFDPPSELARTLPEIRVAGITTIGIQSSLPQGRIANNYVIQDTMTYLRGNHSFRFGLDLLKQRSRQFAPIAERGFFDYRSSSGFTGFANFVDDFGGNGPSTGSVIRDFGSPAYYPELFRQAYFFQDRWRVNQSLTLTLGLRYENFGRPFDAIRTPAYTGLFNVDPVTLSGPYTQPNRVKSDNNNFAPAIGIAYSPSFTEGWFGRLLGDRQSVIRAGYQIGYDSFFNNIASNAQTSSPNVISTSIVSSSTGRGTANLSTLLPTTPRPLRPDDSQTLMDPNLVNPYFQRWSLGIQRSLPGNVLVDISYVGSKGTNLYLNEDRNPLVPANMRITPPGYSAPLCSASTAPPRGCLTGRLDNLQGSRVVRSNSGDSNYHSGQLYVVRRFSKGFQLTGSYTWSKLIDNNSDIFAGSSNLSSSSLPVVPAIFGGDRNDRAVSLYDRTHRASFTYYYELPFMREQKGVIGRILGGFAISGVTTFESGVPFTVANGQDSNGLGGNNDRPDFNPLGRKGVRAIPATATSPSPTGYINPDIIIGRVNNTDVFAPIDPRTARYIGIPTGAGRTGTLGRHTERMPGINNWDFNIIKRIALSENTRLELRTEFHNVFNHPQYGQGSISPFSPSDEGMSASVFSSAAGRFLNPTVLDAGGRVIRYEVKFVF